jgi:hypothetical protein
LGANKRGIGANAAAVLSGFKEICPKSGFEFKSSDVYTSLKHLLDSKK